ncbi:MAG: hypothetical protein ACI8ZO_000402 [Flavobacteriales bacterium]|jgi:hypothetical protein
MKVFNKIVLASIAVSLSFSVSAKEYVKSERTVKKTTTPLKAIADACDPAQSRTDLAVNNVRTTILGGGDLWWDLTSAQYEVPIGSNKHSLFAGSLWIGGLDDGNQLKVAAMTYRQDGNDFWPGPIDPVSVTTDKLVCNAYDKHFEISVAAVKEHLAWLEDPASVPGYTIPNEIKNWPGDSEDGSRVLAPYVDRDGNGSYDPDSDYPAYDLKNNINCGSLKTEEDGILFGDKTLFWIFNDKGDIHSETGAESIGLEIHAQAFGFATNDDVNNMTFYSYKIINRATVTLNQVYIGQWVDADLGDYQDDYVGCDVGRGLGYCYNGDGDDGGANGYGSKPPAIGMDFFQGPLADENDGIDNDRDGTVDEAGEQITMSKFVYYNNNFSLSGNPQTGTHYYNYLDGKWKDGQAIVYGGDGRTSGGVPCDFMFPGDTDPEGWGTAGVPQAPWTEETALNPPDDRRFLQSAGKFTLKPGAVNFVTVGAVWAQTNIENNAFASVEDMRIADDLAQALFDNCFRVSDGPDAPTVDVIEGDQKLILTLSNAQNSNNYNEGYEEKDPLIINSTDTNFVFEGYQIYQLKNETVSGSELSDPSLARLIAQYDIKNGIGQLVNYEEDKAIGALVPAEMVNGADLGIEHAFAITEDQFATGNKTLVNHKDYYFMAIAYSYNNYKTYNPADENFLDGQKKPYKAGRNNIKSYKGTPHKLSPSNGGVELNAAFGTQVEITRLRGAGNGGYPLYLTEETIAEILVNNCATNPVYSTDGGPIKVQVLDPLQVKPNEYRVEMNGTGANATFTLFDVTGGDTVVSPNNSIPIGLNYEQLYPEYGISITLNEARAPGDGSNKFEGNGFISASIDNFSWLGFVGDIDATGSALDWIRAGSNTGDVGEDSSAVYENVLGGRWAPYSLVSLQTVNETEQGHGPAWNKFQNLNKIENTPSVDIVFTADKALWTRVPVIETQDELANAEGGAEKMRLRSGNSVDKDGLDDGSGTGWGWFPGYAIDVDRGIRLNMMFGEDSWLAGENGRDMVWNPTSRFATNLGGILFGGKHYVYVMNSQYNGSNEQANPYFTGFEDPTNVNLRNIYKDVNWVSIPLLITGSEFLSSDVTVNLRVNQPYIEWEECGVTSGDPAWGFNTVKEAANVGNLEVAKSALDLIGVVPNPYYAYSEYEATQLENKVKVINIPSQCIVSIYTVNGVLIRRFQKESPETFLEWDLKNYAGIPVASGVYIFHIDAGDAGEKIVKWFGATRPIDLDTF